MFDTPGTGLMASVKSVTSKRALERILTLIVQSLFIGSTDTKARDNFLAIAREATNEQSENFQKSMDAAVVLLQHLRQYAENQNQANPNSAESGVTPEVESSTGDSALSANEILLKTFTRSVRRPFSAMVINQKPESTELPEKLPFLLSPAFADHFIGLLERKFFPVLLQSFRGILVQADELEESQREEFLMSKLEGRKQQAFLMETWQTVWSSLIDEKKIPKKPEVKAGGAFKNMLKKIDTRQPTGRRELTIEQWQAKKDEIKAANKASVKMWQDICRDSEDYLAPQDTDKELLRDMFGRSAAGLEKQMTALMQIATQGGSVKAFETYIQTRKVDLSFLTVTFRHPELFIEVRENDEEDDAPKESLIKRVLKGYNESSRQEMFPLLHRYVLSSVA
ncbi:MAG: hypothetical protein HN377_02720 [Alphaproteobacteria bacterium]|nr:hypothetical protein [Alphaproteobacteria bacterium]MBT7942191.1 hypothetical protein [Alphaproteobacteria bacterium]